MTAAPLTKDDLRKMIGDDEQSLALFDSFTASLPEEEAKRLLAVAPAMLDAVKAGDYPAFGSVVSEGLPEYAHIAPVLFGILSEMHAASNQA